MVGRAVVLSTRPTRQERVAVLELVETADAASDHPTLSESQRAALAEIGAEEDGAKENSTPGDASPIRIVWFDRGAAADRRPVGVSQALPSPPDGHLSVELVVDPAVADPDTVRTELLEATVEEVGRRGGLLRLWVPWSSGDDRWARSAGFDHERDLLQLRCHLPLPSTDDPPLPTRPFRPGRDDHAWLRANNRAFAGHPEQGSWTLDTLRQREAEPWFDPAGFLVHDGDDDDVIAAWCWTKVHHTTEPRMGEIYVIGVDPDFQGRGWGRSLTRAGLEWLAGAGLSVGMLYVDAANQAACSLYRSLGFVEDHVDRSYRRVVAPTPPG